YADPLRHHRQYLVRRPLPVQRQAEVVVPVAPEHLVDVADVALPRRRDVAGDAAGDEVLDQFLAGAGHGSSPCIGNTASRVVRIAASTGSAIPDPYGENPAS